MQEYQMIYSRNIATVLILILIPLAGCVPFIAMVLYLPVLKDWMILAGSFLFLAVITGLTLFILKKFASVPCVAGLGVQGIFIRLQHRTPFYPTAMLEGHWSNIANVSSYLDTSHNKRFYLIRFKQPAITVSLMSPDTAVPGEDHTLFGAALMQYVDSYNASHPSETAPAISNKGFYNSWWAKTLTLLACAMSLAVLIGRFVRPDRVSIWKLLQVLTISFIWLSAWYFNTRKK